MKMGRMGRNGKRLTIARRRKRHQQRCQVVYAEESSATFTKKVLVLDPPYTTNYLVKYCTTNWQQWIRDTKFGLDHYQQALANNPTREVADTVVEVEDLYHRMVKVSDTVKD